MAATAARRTVLAAILAALTLASVHGQVAFDRLRDAAGEPRNWLTYSGTYFSQRHSELEQVTPDNVGDLALQWVYQTPVMGTWQATPIVVDGVMYLTQRPNDIVALDARTGRVFWVYQLSDGGLITCACCQAPTTAAWRCWASKVFMATLDARVVALDAATGALLWDVEVADRHLAYAFTLAPLAINGQGAGGFHRRRPGHPRIHRGAGRRDGRGDRGASTPFRVRASAGTRRGSRARPNPGDLLRPGSVEARRRRRPG